MSVIQILLIIVLFLAFVMTWRRANQQAIRRFEALLWSIIWIGAGFLILWPEVANSLADLVGVGRGVDLVLYSAVIGLLLLVFQLHIAHDRLQRTLTELIQQDALRTVPQQDAMEDLEKKSGEDE